MTDQPDLRAAIVEAFNGAYRPNPAGFESLDETSRHDGHNYSGACYVCRGDVEKLTDAVLAVVAPLLWLHAEASWWLALDRDEHESAEQLSVWWRRCEYAEAQYRRAKVEIEQLRREVKFEALGADTFAGADLHSGGFGVSTTNRAATWPHGSPVNETSADVGPGVSSEGSDPDAD